MVTIVWDVDDVLNDLMYQWFTHGWLVEHPECKVSYAELMENPPCAVLGVEKAEYLASLDRFRRTARGQEMTPNVAVLAWFREHGAAYRHIALTARPLESAPDAAHWVMRHFGAWIRCFGIVPTRDLLPGVPVYDENKGDFLEWLGRGDVLVDDTPENLRQAAALGLKAVAFPQPWNWSEESVEAVLQKLAEIEQAIRTGGTI
jgi:hypothetical protein